MTIPTAPPPPADPAASAGRGSPEGSPGSATPRGAERFLLWVAGLGIARSDGWLGGVAAGIAARLRIDPLIVRGVLVIAALFGLPAIFLYAVAWALLPDLDGRVHVRDLLHRRYEPVQLGILAMAVVGLLPSAPLTGRLFGLGYDGWSTLSPLSWIVGLVLVAGLLFLIVRAASRTSPGASAPDLPMASADRAAPDASAPLAGSGPAAGADATSVATEGDPVPGTADDRPADPATPPAPPVPFPPGTDDPDALAAWRAQHAAWKQQDQAWRRQQQDLERATRDHLRRERQASAAQFAAEAAERRRVRRASNPRAGLAFVTAAVGLAIVVGAGVGLTVGEGIGGALGLLCGAVVLAMSMVVAGTLRRRSGFLAFATVVALVGGLVAGAFSTAPGVVFGYASISNAQPAQVRQPFGDLYLQLHEHDGGPRPIVIDKGAGRTEIFVDEGVQLQLRGTLGDGVAVSWMRVEPESWTITDHGTWPLTRRDGAWSLSENVSSANGTASTVQPVTIHQASGDIVVTVHQSDQEER